MTFALCASVYASILQVSMFVPSVQCRVAFQAMLGGQPKGDQTKPMRPNHFMHCTRSVLKLTNTHTLRGD